jgi:hypothetical protein
MNCPACSFQNIFKEPTRPAHWASAGTTYGIENVQAQSVLSEFGKKSFDSISIEQETLKLDGPFVYPG